MEQLELFGEIDESELDKKLKNKLLEFCKKNKLDSDNVIIKVTKSNAEKSIGEIASKFIAIVEKPYPLHSGNTSSMNVISFVDFKKRKDETKNLDIGIRHNTFDQVLDNNITNEIKKTTSDKVYTHVYAKDIDDAVNIIIKALEYELCNYKSSVSSFGCCSKKEECSNKKECIHSNMLYATGCQYRQNLENNRIFYGINKNV